MGSAENINTIKGKLIQDHHTITDQVTRLSEKLKTKDSEFFKEFKEFISFLEKDLIPHFEIEEKVFFPAAIMGASAYETTLMVMQLQKDHGALEKQILSLMETSKTTGFAPETLNEAMLQTVKDFFSRLKIHVKRELIELLPLIDENPRSRSLLKSYAEEFQNRLSGEPEPF